MHRRFPETPPARRTPSRRGGSCAGAVVLPLLWSTAAFPQGVPPHQKPELVVQAGHTLSVNSVAYSPDARWLATAGADRTVKIWEATSGREIRTLPHAAVVWAVAFRPPDGRWLASASGDHRITLWEVATGREVGRLLGHTDSVNAVAFSPDGRLLVSGSGDTTVRIWEVSTGRDVQTMRGHSAWVNAVAFSPDGRSVASGSGLIPNVLHGRRMPAPGDANTVKVWAASTGRELGELSGHAGSVNAVSFSPEGALLASASSDGTVKLWDIASGREVRSLTGLGRSVNGVAFSPDGTTLASAIGGWRNLASGRRDAVTLWDVNAGRERRTLPGYTDWAVGVVFSPDGRFLASGGRGPVKVWETGSGREILDLTGRSTIVESIAFSADGRWLASATRTSITVLDTTTGRPVRRMSGRHLPIVQLDVSARSPSILAAASWDGTASLWDLATGRELVVLRGHAGQVSAVTLVPDGSLVATGGSDRTVKIWDAVAGREVRTLTGHRDRVLSVACSPDGTLVASGSADETIRLWEVATGREVRTVDAPGLTRALRFSPDGRVLASSSGEGVQLWDVGGGRELHAWKTSPSSTLVFSPDGRILASGNGHDITFWDTQDGRELRTLSGSTGPVRGVAFRPDGRYLASGGYDGAIRIWDAAEGTELAIFTAAREGNGWVAVTPNGLFDGSSHDSNLLVAWRISNRVYPPDRFFADYYTPGLLADIFAGGRPKPGVDLAALKLPPDVRITSPPTGSALQQQVVVRVEAADQGGGVAVVRLYQNGKLVGERPGQSGSRSTYEFTVDLVAGENALKATALTGDRVESNDDFVRLVVSSREAPRPTLHVLVVGINEYQDPAFDLGFARPDAAALADFFERNGRHLFGSVQAVRLFDSDATRAAILGALDALAERARPEDVVVIYLAGHGVGLGQQFYFLPHEMRRGLDEEAAVRKYGITASLIGEFLGHARTRALKQLLVLDTCYSGAALNVLAKVAQSRGRTPEDRALEMLARSEGIYLIAAATSQQMAYEVPELGHGVLTYALLSGLGEKGTPQAPPVEGVVTVLSLLTYASSVVPDLAARYHGGSRQQVNVSITGMDFPLALP